MSFIGPGQGPHIGKINLLTGAGSKATDPLGIFTPQKTTPPPPPINPVQPWTRDSNSETAEVRAARAAAAGPVKNPLSTDDDDTASSKQLLGGSTQGATA